MTATPDDARWIKQQARELGLTLCGISDAKPTRYAEHFDRWLATNQHGSMDYLNRHTDVRKDPQKLLEGVRAIICVGRVLPRDDADVPDDHGRIARYAQFADYHKTLKKTLHRLADTLRTRWGDAEFRCCVDTAPLFEREYAQRAGLGWQGKHTLTLNRDLGSHLMLGEILSTLALPPDTAETDHCGTCSRCIDACPTDCISPYSMDASRCISYFTIEHRGPIDPAHHAAIGSWIFGCDICQDVCPYVQRAASRAEDAESDAASQQRLIESLDPMKVMRWTAEDRAEALRGTAMKRGTLMMWIRNAMIVATNQALAEMRAVEPTLCAIEAATHRWDHTPVLRQTMEVCVARLSQVQ